MERISLCSLLTKPMSFKGNQDSEREVLVQPRKLSLPGWVSWCIHVNTQRGRQEDQEVMVILSYIVTKEPAWTI